MKIGKFISLVKERPVIYDSLHPQYKDRKEKEKTWREISTAMNIHTDIARSRWKSLKDCYTKYLKSTMATGPAVYLRYINWQWAEHMEFMKPHIKFGLIISNIELQDQQETDHVSTQSSSDVLGRQSSLECEEMYECRTVRSSTPNKSEHEISDSHEKTETQETSGTHKRPEKLETSKVHERTKEKVKRRRHVAMVSPDVNISPNSYRFLQYLENKKTDSFSATELIFLGYAKTIKTFSIRRQAQVKMKIAKIMMEEEIANFEESISHSEYQ